MTTLRQAIRVKRAGERSFELWHDITLGVIVEVNGSVEADRPGFVWVREGGQDGGVTQVFNAKAPALKDHPVLIGYGPKKPFRRQILDTNWEILATHPDYDGDPYLPEHHETHEWPDGEPGRDPVTVYGRSLAALRIYPGSSGLTIDVAPYRYEKDGDIVTFPGHEGYDISGSQPAAGLARYVLIYLKTDDNTISTVDGDTTVDASPVTPSFPAPPLKAVPSAWIRLDGAATSITESDVVDARMFLNEITGQMAAVLNGLAAVESEIDFEISKHLVEHGKEMTQVLAILEAEYDYALSAHAVQG